MEEYSEELKVSIREALSSLDENALTVLEARCLGVKRKTRAEIAKELHVSGPWIGALERVVRTELLRHSWSHPEALYVQEAARRNVDVRDLVFPRNFHLEKSRPMDNVSP